MQNKRYIARLILFAALACGPSASSGNGVACEGNDLISAGSSTAIIGFEIAGAVENRSAAAESFSLEYLYDEDGKSIGREVSVDPDSTITFKLTYSLQVDFTEYRSVKNIGAPLKIFIQKGNRKIRLRDLTINVVADLSTRKGEGSFSYIFYGNLPAGGYL